VFCLRIPPTRQLVYLLALCVSLAPCDAPGEIIVQLGQNFTASTFGIDANLVPPDSDGAIGPAHFVEFINGRFSVFDKVSATKVQTSSGINFWSNAGVTIPSGALVSDPRIIYDPNSSRWFASQIDFFPGNEVSNRFLLAVSATSDPTGSWNGVGWMADPGGSFADFPRLGLVTNAVVVAGMLNTVTVSASDVMSFFRLAR